MSRDVYFSHVKLYGEENEQTLEVATNYAWDLIGLRRFEEAKALMLKVIPAARRVLGESHEFTLQMRANYATSLYADADATLDDLREALTTLEDAGRIARRVFGSAHPITMGLEDELQKARRVAAWGRSKGSN